MFLSEDTFSTVIKSTPLVSIDLVVKNKQGHALLGRRLNKPAKDYWFVPGGRIQKDESLSDAFKRLTHDELGQKFNIKQAELLGPFDHFYSDNVFGHKFSTHYVAIAYVLIVDKDLCQLPINVQHERYQWFERDELLISDEVHLHTKWYFNESKYNNSNI